MFDCSWGRKKKKKFKGKENAFLVCLEVGREKRKEKNKSDILLFGFQREEKLKGKYVFLL